MGSKSITNRTKAARASAVQPAKHIQAAARPEYIGETTLPVKLQTVTKRVDLNEVSLKLHYALAIADVLCFADEMINVNDDTLSTIAWLQSDLLHSAKELVDGVGTRPSDALARRVVK
jgi:hypothetical protein